MEKIKKETEKYWDKNPCGSKFVKEEIGTEAFFESIEKERYLLEPHILEMVPFGKYANKKVLEIGCGVGTDGVQFAKNSADYYAIDLTPNHIKLAKKRFELLNLKGEFRIADTENLPFADNTFDLVYSHGVLHHTPDTQKAIDEIYRVLKPHGRAIIMLYHKNSYNYHINIMLLRRIGVFLLYLPGGTNLVNKLTGEDLQKLLEHKKNLISEGMKYLSAQRFLTQNTDGPGNPLSKVYTRKEVLAMFHKFENVRTDVKYLNKRHVPIIGKYISKNTEKILGRLFGWHIYIFAAK